MANGLHWPMGEPKVHLFLHEDFDGLPVLVMRLEGDDNEMIEVGMHDWRVAVQWAVVMQYGAMSMAERCGADLFDVQTAYANAVEQVQADSQDD